MTRPNTVHVLEAWRDDAQQSYYWCDFGGTEVLVVVPDRAVLDRKIGYGYAHVVQELVPGEVRDDGTHEIVAGDRYVVDDTPDADTLALRAILAEHLDRWEAHGVPIGDGDAPPRPSKNKNPFGFTRDSKREVNHPVPSKAPAPDVKPVQHVTKSA